jgi:hypothetical protein
VEALISSPTYNCDMQEHRDMEHLELVKAPAGWFPDVRTLPGLTSSPVSGTVNPAHPRTFRSPLMGERARKLMAGIEHTRGKTAGGEVQPDDHNEIGEGLQWMRLTYALDYPARTDSWERPEDYPQSWDVRAYIDADILEPDYDTLEADAQGRVTVAEASVYLIPDVGDVNLFETLDAHSAELSQFAEAFIAAGSEPSQLSIEGEPVLEGDLMVVSWVNIQPRFRGHRAGHQVLKAILDAIGRGTVVTVLRAAPGLQDGVEEGSAKHRMECRGLAKYWGEVGFRPLHRNIMVLTYDDILVMLDDDDQEDADIDELRDVPLMQLSQKQRDAVFRNLRIKLDE